MPGPLNCVCLCWISVSFLLHGPQAFTSNQHQLPNVTVVEGQEDAGWGSPFLQLRASLPSFSQSMRPYALLTNMEDYHRMPRPRHRRPSRLLRLLGSSFDPFWMSVEQPPDTSGGHGGDTLDVQILNHSIIKEKSSLREAAANQHQKLEVEAAALDLGPLPPDVASSFRSWLVRSATCELHYQWKDLGPAFWPRWLRQTDCGSSDRMGSCSFPSGMECVRAKTAHVKILAWHCLEIRDGGDGSTEMKSERNNGSTDVEETSEAVKSCLWSQVPYPVVTACKCSCK
ncbi:noggin-2-like [Solea solea]|uniref:noggin-2-like n=1 Tax=Solea solea TaxID=90069 RepID=UPI00272B57E5|nr:noggin-2-like [Solea solea]